MFRTAVVVVAVLAVPAHTLLAQQHDSIPARDTLRTRTHQLNPITVTVTRNAGTTFDAPQAVSVIDSTDLRRRPLQSPVDLLVDLPGTDITGVGPNQLRPVIRGFTGQRILLLEDGLRLTNPRRQQDFGEIPGVVDMHALDRVEVVRGPSSVLYGSDAIGGVINLVSEPLPWGTSGSVAHGALRYAYTGGTASTSAPSATFAGRSGRFAFRVDGGFRDASPYSSGTGTYGGVTLASPALVNGTGVKDRDVLLQAGYALSASSRVFARFGSYRALDAGFGYIDPALLGADQPSIRISYPAQHVDRLTTGVRAADLHSILADRVEASVYLETNRRDLAQDIFAPFGPGTPPGAGVSVTTANFTDVQTVGVRVEAGRAVGAMHRLTYGVDFSHDRTTNTDSSVTTVVGFGPPEPDVSTTPSVPNASFRMTGVFLQDQWAATSRLALTFGARYQENTAGTRTTPGLTDAPVTSSDRALVGTANALYSLTEDVNLIGSIGRGFRSPNLVERFFNGVTPEGDGFQERNTALKPETSLNVELGLRIRRRAWSAQAFGFQSDLHDGIRLAATGDTTAGFPVFQNVNIDKLRVRGLEVGIEWSPVASLMLGASYTVLDEQNVAQPLLPVSDGYGNKITAAARFHSLNGSRWIDVGLRHQGRRDGFELEPNPVGSALPAFTTIGLDAGMRVLRVGTVSHTLTAGIENIGNVLYAEAANTGFFRPQPGRRVFVGWRSEF